MKRSFLENRPYRTFAIALLSSVLFIASLYCAFFTSGYADFFTSLFISIFAAALYAFALFSIYRIAPLRSPDILLVMSVPIALAILFRIYCLDHVTTDYTVFLSQWTNYFRDNGGFLALDSSIGNYNIPYLYFLALFSYLPFPDLYLIKLLSVFFDFILALYCTKLLSVFTKNQTKLQLCYCIVLLLPTVLLNGSYWGQCDSIYVSFAIMSLYYALSGRPFLSVSLLAVSFSFKLQAVFFMPIFLLLLFSKHIRIRHLFAFPAAYILTILPAVFLGRPFFDALLIYFNQIDTVGELLNYNSPSAFAFPWIESLSSPAVLEKIGICMAFALVSATAVLFLIRRNRINADALLTASFLFAVGIPFLLPHMHDRYFFGADILSVAYALVHLKRIPLIAATSFASLLGYFAYLKGFYYLPMYYGSILLLITILVLIYDIVQTNYRGRRVRSR